MLFPAYRPPCLCKRVCLARRHASPQDLEPRTPLLRAGVLPGPLRAARHGGTPGTGLPSASPGGSGEAAAAARGGNAVRAGPPLPLPGSWGEGRMPGASEAIAAVAARSCLLLQ